MILQIIVIVMMNFQIVCLFWILQLQGPLLYFLEQKGVHSERHVLSNTCPGIFVVIPMR